MSKHETATVTSKRKAAMHDIKTASTRVSQSESSIKDLSLTPRPAVHKLQQICDKHEKDSLTG